MSINKILIADDSEAFIESIKSALLLWRGDTNKWIIHSVRSPKELLSVLKKEAYDCLLLDLVFDEDHPDFLQGLIVLPDIVKNFPELSIVIMTNYGSGNTTQQAMNLGARDFINKKNLVLLEWENRLNNYCELTRKTRRLMPNIDTETKNMMAELEDIEQALIKSNGNKSIAAKTLNKTPDQILYFIKKKANKKRPDIVKHYYYISLYYKVK